MSAEAVFRAKAPVLMARLISEFAFSVEDAAAIAGNGGHESLGFTKLQEIKPTVAGSAGGYGWFQWTGPRRRSFEAYARSKELDVASDEANISFLLFELKTTEKSAIAKTKAAKGLEDKVKAFELGFERAGVKHYPERIKWAGIALDAYQKVQGADPSPEPTQPAPPSATDPAKPRSLLLLIIDLILSIFKRK